MAQRWANFSDNDNRYYLQYRTDGGPNVRDSHAALNNTTLPKSDPFWDSYTPQNGWNCHCMVVEVLAMRYEKSDSKTAVEKGEKATTQIGKDGKNKLEIFRFNPGTQKVIFPPNHPYNKVVGAKEVKANLIDKNKLKEQRVEIREWAKQNLVGKTVKHSKIKEDINFTVTGIKEALNQPHKHIVEKNEAVKNIKSLIKDSEFVKMDVDIKGRDIEYYYLRTIINKEDSFIVIKRQDNINSFYSISDKIKE